MPTTRSCALAAYKAAVGKNAYGVGKSSITVRLIMGLDATDAGSALVGGVRPAGKRYADESGMQ
jgi:hypothetical protein